MMRSRSTVVHQLDHAAADELVRRGLHQGEQGGIRPEDDPLRVDQGRGDSCALVGTQDPWGRDSRSRVPAGDDASARWRPRAHSRTVVRHAGASRVGGGSWMRVDLNADLGEGVGDDEAMLAIVTSANIATGAHAGGGVVLARAVTAACPARGGDGRPPLLPGQGRIRPGLPPRGPPPRRVGACAPGGRPGRADPRGGPGGRAARCSPCPCQGARRAVQRGRARPRGRAGRGRRGHGCRPCARARGCRDDPAGWGAGARRGRPRPGRHRRGLRGSWVHAHRAARAPQQGRGRARGHRRNGHAGAGPGRWPRRPGRWPPDRRCRGLPVRPRRHARGSCRGSGDPVRTRGRGMAGGGAAARGMRPRHPASAGAVGRDARRGRRHAGAPVR